MEKPNILRSETPPWDIIEGHVTGPAFDAQMHFTRWPVRGAGVFESRAPFVEMILGASMEVKGSYASSVRSSDYATVGCVAFVPQGVPLHCIWAPGTQRCISCNFDVGALTEAAEMEWTWPDFDPADALTIRNEYVSLGLRRIAEEVLSPGFASAAQVECALMFVAFELRRHLAKGENSRWTGGKLTAKQLALLRGMVIDTPDAAPTIAELAAACGMGSRKLALAYRKTTGVTLRCFIANARLDRAKMLLLDRSKLIKQIAFDSGFQSSAAFIGAFRKATGMTPVEFRATLSVAQVY
jgi:AraC family transcriptional regulator